MGLARWLRSLIGRPKGLSRRGRHLLREGDRRVRELDGSPAALQDLSEWWEEALQELPEDERNRLREISRRRERVYQAAAEYWVNVGHRRRVEQVIRDAGGKP